jgi:hypothetical protein
VITLSILEIYKFSSFLEIGMNGCKITHLLTLIIKKDGKLGKILNL